MSVDENKTIARRFIEEVCNRPDLELANELIVEDYVHHDPSLPPELQRGRENYKKLFGMFLTAFPDLHGTIEDIVAEGDRVASRVQWKGTHKGELQTIPPTGRPVNFGFMQIQRIEEGKIAEGWVIFDSLGMMQQLGVIPSPEGAGV